MVSKKAPFQYWCQFRKQEGITGTKIWEVGRLEKNSHLIVFTKLARGADALSWWVLSPQLWFPFASFFLLQVLWHSNDSSYAPDPFFLLNVPLVEVENFVGRGSSLTDWWPLRCPRKSHIAIITGNNETQ